MKTMKLIAVTMTLLLAPSALALTEVSTNVTSSVDVRNANEQAQSAECTVEGNDSSACNDSCHGDGACSGGDGGGGGTGCDGTTVTVSGCTGGRGGDGGNGSGGQNGEDGESDG